MSELMRFRLSRAPQKQAIAEESLVFIERPLADPELRYNIRSLRAALAHLLANVGPYVIGYNDTGLIVLGKPAQLVSHVADIERWLTETKNSPNGEELSLKLHEICHGIDANNTPAQHNKGELGKYARLLLSLEDGDWGRDRLNIAFSLMVAVLRDGEPNRAVYFNRLLLVFGLIELAAQNPDRLGKSQDIYWALRSRTVILPQAFVDYLRSKSGARLLARRPGFADLYIVRNEWVRYEAGEIAHIENVMATEVRERKLTSTTETEQTTTTTEQRRSFNEQDSQTTDRFNLHAEVSQDSSLNIKVDGSVDVSGQYGTAKISTHLGGGLDYSLNESQNKASDMAHESVSRSVTRVEEQVTQARTLRSLSRIVEKNSHSFKNDTPGAVNISGIYRWVNKIERMQIFRYPNRFLLEFQVPEPGAWLRWILDQKRPKTASEAPLPLTIDGTETGTLLKFTDINNNNYAQIAARYKTLGINPPPDDRIVSIVLSRPSSDTPQNDSAPIRFQIDKTLTVPDGWQATTWKAFAQSWHNNSINDNAGISLFLAVGEGLSWSFSGKWSVMNVPLNGSVGDISVGSIPISVMTDTAYGFNINILVRCQPLARKVDEWKIETYEKITQAYYEMKRQHDDELAALSIRGGVHIDGLSPGQNEEMTRLEIRKAIVEMLTTTNYAQHFDGCNAIDRVDAANKPISPQINLQKAVQTTSQIQFIEQAFEWENMTYVLYPYFWTGKDQWDRLVDLSGADPNLARFLRAGSARVILPARPGFEPQAQMYVDFGILWGGGPAPAPGEDDYLSVADEIRAQEQAPRDGIPGESWEVSLPTTLVWLDTTSTSLPVAKPNVTLDPPPGKVLP